MLEMKFKLLSALLESLEIKRNCTRKPSMLTFQHVHSKSIHNLECLNGNQWRCNWWRNTDTFLAITTTQKISKALLLLKALLKKKKKQLYKLTT